MLLLLLLLLLLFGFGGGILRFVVFTLQMLQLEIPLFIQSKPLV